MSTWRPSSRLPKWLSWLPKWSHTPLVWMFRISLVGLLILGAIAFFYWIKTAKYDLAEVSTLPTQTTILDRNGESLAVSWGSARHLARRDDLPDFLVSCLEAREDARFFEHHGVDFRGLVRASVRNVKDGDFTQGASTLTMQLARNTYGMREKSIHRKLMEIALTLRIEGRYSKDEILTHYLNRIYFGSGCHGIKEASLTYFGKDVSDLHEGECAMLIGIIRGPHIYSPLNNMKAARAQQSEVLSRLIDMGRIDQAEKERIQALFIKLNNGDSSNSEQSYAIKAIRDELGTLLEANDIRSDGLTVHTTLDNSWQTRLENDIYTTLKDAEESGNWKHPIIANHKFGESPQYLQCSAVTLDSKTGGILALIGGRDYLDSRYDRSDKTRRDLGKAFEIWIAAAAYERGKRVIPGNPLLTGRQLGPIETARIAKRCGLGGDFLNNDDLFRGGAAATPMETAIALATIANDGKRPTPHFITKITDHSGEVLYERKPETSQAIQASAAKRTLDMFDSVGSSKCFHGSTGSEHDAWILRIGPSGSTAIWLGFDNSKKITTDSHLDKILSDLGNRLAK